MLMREQDYDQLFRLLCALKMEAPCKNGACIGYDKCDYCFDTDECAIDIVREEANRRYKYRGNMYDK